MKKYLLLIMLVPFMMGTTMGPRVNLFNHASACYISYVNKKECVNIQGHKTAVCWCINYHYGGVSCTCAPPQAMTWHEHLQYALYWLTKEEP